ncbi:MAG: FAD:protein FMN transferase, partial [Micromonosporaceae bacterium]
ARVPRRSGVGVVASLGGDIPTPGPAPDGGWRVLVHDSADDPHTTVTLPAGAALATSSTVRRRWRCGGQSVHHIVDPRTGAPARPVWRSASVVAWRCLDANVASTAAVVRAERARGWLRRIGLPARLVDAERTVHTLNGWPDEQP